MINIILHIFIKNSNIRPTPFLIVIVLFGTLIKSYTIVVNLKSRFETVFQRLCQLREFFLAKYSFVVADKKY